MTEAQNRPFPHKLERSNLTAALAALEAAETGAAKKVLLGNMHSSGIPGDSDFKNSSTQRNQYLHSTADILTLTATTHVDVHALGTLLPDISTCI